MDFTIFSQIGQWFHQLTQGDWLLIAYIVSGTVLATDSIIHYQPLTTAVEAKASTTEPMSGWTILFGMASIVSFIVGFFGGWGITAWSMWQGTTISPIPFWVGILCIPAFIGLHWYQSKVLVPRAWAISRAKRERNDFTPTAFPNSLPGWIVVGVNILCATMIVIS